MRLGPLDNAFLSTFLLKIFSSNTLSQRSARSESSRWSLLQTLSAPHPHQTHCPKKPHRAYDSRLEFGTLQPRNGHAFATKMGLANARQIR